MSITNRRFFTPLPSFSGAWELVENQEVEAIRKEISKPTYRDESETGNHFLECVQNTPCIVRKAALNFSKVPTQIIEVLFQKSQRLVQSILLIETPQSLSFLNEDASYIINKFSHKTLDHENGSLQEYIKVCFGCAPPRRLFSQRTNQPTHSCSSKFETSEHSSYLLEGLKNLKAYLFAYDELDSQTKLSIEEAFSGTNSKILHCSTEFDVIVLNSNKVWKLKVSIDSCGWLTLLESNLIADLEHNLKQKTLHLGVSKLIRKSESGSPIKAFDWGEMFGFKLDRTQPLKSGGLN